MKLGTVLINFNSSRQNLLSLSILIYPISCNPDLQANNEFRQRQNSLLPLYDSY